MIPPKGYKICTLSALTIGKDLGVNPGLWHPVIKDPPHTITELDIRANCYCSEL